MSNKRDFAEIYSLSYVGKKIDDPVKNMFINLSKRDKGIFEWYDWGLTNWEIKDKDIDDGVDRYNSLIMQKNVFIKRSYQELKDEFCDYNMCRSYIDAENIIEKITDKKLVRPFPFLSKFAGIEFKFENNFYTIKTFKEYDLKNKNSLFVV
jgi:hypothetical protein